MFKHYENTKTKREKNAARFSWVIDTNFPLNHSEPANSLVSILKLFFLFLFCSHSLSVYLLGTIHKYFEPDNGLFSLVCLACISTHTHDKVRSMWLCTRLWHCRHSCCHQRRCRFHFTNVNMNILESIGNRFCFYFGLVLFLLLYCCCNFQSIEFKWHFLPSLGFIVAVW